jgi:cytochrome c biogenesis protein CcdA/thiol-disulfide isomerase/thioredoxin
VAELLVVAFIGGLITGLSPCIVPVLPVIVAGGSSGTNRSRPVLIIAGLVLSFSLAELLGSTVLSAIGLPQDFLFWLGVTLLFILAAGLLVPAIGVWTERPFAKLGTSRYSGSRGGFLLGLSLGLVFVPCAGPVLTAISVAAANHRVSASSLFVTLFYTAGAAVPLLVLGALAQRAASGWKRFRARLPTVRRVAGAILAVTTLAIAFGLFDPLQRDVPGYTSSLEDRIESGSSITSRLQAIDGEHPNQFVTAAKKAAAAAKLAKSAEPAKTKPAGGKPSSSGGPVPTTGTVTKTVASAGAPTAVKLPNLGPAPNFTGIVAWLNTPGGRPLTLAELRGKVVLIDFWTYSCINCQRALPHVEAWYNDYKKYGFVVVGVHTPEFAFEHVVSNVRSAARALGVDYPIAVDSNYKTWDAYNNEYWPADYLLDPTGHVRVYQFGEGGYTTLEDDIRELLTANGVTHLPPPTDVPNKTPTAAISPESYLGYNEISYNVGPSPAQNKAVDYHAPATIGGGLFAFNGWWADHFEEATAGANAEIVMHFRANDVYLVMGGKGTVSVSFNGRPLRTVTVAGIPKLYTLLSGTPLQTGYLEMKFSAGIQAYDFTFG